MRLIHFQSLDGNCSGSICESKVVGVEICKGKIKGSYDVIIMTDRRDFTIYRGDLSNANTQYLRVMRNLLAEPDPAPLTLFNG